AQHKEVQSCTFRAIGDEKHDGAVLTTDEIEELKRVLFDHCRVELDVTNREWKARLDEAAREAELLGARLEVVMFFATMESSELEDVASTLAGKGRLHSHVLPLAAGHLATPRRLQEQVERMLNG